MKTLFIPVYSTQKLQNLKILSKKLPKNIAIFYSVQFKTQAEEIKNYLKKSKSISQFSQILGCSSPKISPSTKAVLLVGSGKFHALALNLETPLFLFSDNRLSKIDKKEFEHLNKKKKAAYLNFLNSEKTGILISTKPGQQNLQKAVYFKKSSPKKQFYLFLGNNLTPSEFENFPEIKSWVNTACPRLSEDNARIVNLGDLSEYF